MLFLPILAAKIDVIFHTPMGRLELLKHCVSVILWRFARCAFGKSSGKEYMEDGGICFIMSRNLGRSCGKWYGQRLCFSCGQQPWVLST